jgi:reactive chlorine resistance protein C
MNILRQILERLARFDWLAIGITRCSLVVVFLWMGVLKAFPYQDEAIVPLVANSPLMNFLYRQPAGEYRQHMNMSGEVVPANVQWHEKNKTYPVAYALGFSIVLFGVMVALHPWFPAIAAIGSFFVAAMSVVTLSFLVTTPECWVPNLGSPQHGFPYLSGVGSAIVKDVILLGAGLVTMVDSAKTYLKKSNAVHRKMVEINRVPVPVAA